jgi:hypothetical protein
MLLVGLAVGLILGNVLVVNAVMPEEVAYLSMVLLWGGLSLVLFYGIHKKLINEDES